jgi:heat shock protein HslJ
MRAGVMIGGALLAAVAVAAGCAAYGSRSAEDPNFGGVPMEQPLEGTTWSLAVVGGRPARPIGTGGAPTLRLDAAQQRAEGDTGCNRFGGPYELTGGSLRFGALVSTRRACVDEALNAQEAAFLGALEQTRSWRIVGGTLVLSGDAGEVARFAPQR